MIKWNGTLTKKFFYIILLLAGCKEAYNPPVENSNPNYLVVEGNFITETLIKCYNLRGEEFFIQRAAPAKTMIDLTGLEPGFYLIQISNEETAAILKFVKR